jgi:hypothetical protein
MWWPRERMPELTAGMYMLFNQDIATSRYFSDANGNGRLPCIFSHVFHGPASL